MNAAILFIQTDYFLRTDFISIVLNSLPSLPGQYISMICVLSSIILNTSFIVTSWPLPAEGSTILPVSVIDLLAASHGPDKYITPVPILSIQDDTNCFLPLS